MIPKELKALIDEHCMGKKDYDKIEDSEMTLIMDKVQETKADAEEVQKYMDEVIKGPTKAEREAAAKAEAERKAKEAAEKAEKERLAAIERAKREKAEAERKAKEAAERAQREKEEAERKAKKAAEREKKEALFKELKKKYPAADISGIGHILIYDKPIDQWETIFKASARQQTLNKIQNIAYWTFFTILLIGAFVCAYQFVQGGWDSFLVVSLILAAFGVNGYYRYKGKESENPYEVTTWCVGLLWQHYFVHGFWWTLLALIIIFLFPLLYEKHPKRARILTWIVSILVAACFSLFLFTDVTIVDKPAPVEMTESVESSYEAEEMKYASYYDESDYDITDNDITESTQSNTSKLTVKEQLKIRYDYVYSFSDGVYKVEKNGKKGFCDKNGKELLPCQYDYIYGKSNGVYKVEKGDKKGFVDAKTFKVLVPCEYDYIYSESDGLIKVEKGDKKGFLNAKTYKLVTPCIYDYIYSPEGNLIKVEQGDKIGYLNRDGSLLKKPE